MRARAGLWLGVVVVVVGMSACTPSGECQRSSDCEGGSTCVARKCQAAATDAGPLFSSSSGGSSGGAGSCFSMVPGAVYIHGTMSEGACYRDALSTLSQPGNGCVGFGCDTEPGAIRPDGRYIYVDTMGGVVREFTADPFRFAGSSWEYPENTADNDPVVPTPGCPPQPGVYTIMFFPDTAEMLYRCFNASAWYDSAGAIAALNGNEILCPGNGGRLLVRNGGSLEVLLRNGMVTPVTGLPANANWIAYRSAGNGFYVAHLDGNTGVGERWLIQEDGSAVLSTSWTGLPANITARPYSCVMGGGGDLYCEGSDSTVTFQDVVVQFPVGGGQGNVPYTEANLEQDWTNGGRKPDVKLHISKLVTGF